MFRIAVNEYAEFSGEMQDNCMFLHFKFTGDKFTKSIYNELLDMWAEFCDFMRDSGHQRVYSNIPKDDRKAMKWQGLFGMYPIGETETHIVYEGDLNG